MCNIKIIKELKLKPEPSCAIINSVVGRRLTHGRVNLNLKIGELENIVTFLIVDEFSSDLLLGLDIIRKFKLEQMKNLNIQQNLNENESIKIENYRDVEFRINYLTNYIDKEDIEKVGTDIQNLDLNQRELLIKLLINYQHLFAKDKYDVSPTFMAKADVKLIKNQIIAQRPYKCTIPDGIEIENQIEKLLQHNLIEQSTSPYAAPVTLADKKDEKRSRLCIDFSRLNKIIEEESQPFLRIEDIVDKLVDCSYFSKLDLNSAFWSVPLSKEDRFKTAFVTKSGHFQWRVLPFGLKTAPAIFQRILSAVLRKHKCSTYAVNYMDDILIFSKSFEDHISQLKNVLNALKKENFKLKFSKCEFAKNRVNYLGHLISFNSIQPINDDLITIKKAISPSNIDQLRRYLGKINFYYKYIPNAARKLEPLHNLLRQGIEFNWTAECESAFRNINEYLCNEPILKIFDPSKTSYIFTDASGFGLAATLKQISSDNELHPIAYFSMKLPEIKTRRDAIFIELLAIKKAIDYWHYYLYGTEFVVITDHKPLECMKIKCKPDTKIGQMIMYLDQYNFKILYKEGKLNIEADELSRLPVLDYYDGETNLKHANLIELEDIKLLQKNLNTKYLQQHNSFKQIDGIWFKIKNDKKKVVVDLNTGRDLIARIHYRFGHLGKSKLINLLSKRYYFDNLTKRVADYIEKCEICIKNKSRRPKKIGYSNAIGPANHPYSIMSLDTIGGFAKYVHILIDHCTRFMWCCCSSTQTAKDFINLLKQIGDVTKIERLLADQYSGINSTKFKEFLNINDIELLFSPVNNPQSNGLIERAGQTIANRIRCKLNDDKVKTKSFSKIVQESISEYNETPHESTGFSPQHLLLGINQRLSPFDKPMVMEDARKEALHNSEISKVKNEERLNKLRKEKTFNIGDHVYVELSNKLNRIKSAPIREGPFEILEIISPLLYRLSTDKKRRENNIFHKNNLIPYLN